MKKALRFILIFVAILSLVSWLSSIAYGQTSGGAPQTGIQVEAAPPEAAPTVKFFGNAIGGVTAGDLFYINTTGSQLDISASLYITNPDELIHYLRYLILKVAVYAEDGNGQWQPITSQGGIALPSTYITLQNSPVTFTLPGQAHYKITIESGSYHCLPFNSGGGEIAPQFYLNIEPI